MRHAKAESTAPSDHQRALSARGRADAAEAGSWLRQHGIVADAALVSDALRTQQTWAGVAAGAQWSLEPELSAGLYDAGPESTLDLMRETSEGVGTLVVIGHNPTMAYLAELIDDGDGDDAAITGLVSLGYPTCSLTVFGVRGTWAGLGPGAGTVELFHVGGS